MAITVKFFASLREELGIDTMQMEIASRCTAAEVWQEATGGRALPPNLLVALNMEYARPDSLVSDGDEIAFFPPVTGG